MIGRQSASFIENAGCRVRILRAGVHAPLAGDTASISFGSSLAGWPSAVGNMAGCKWRHRSPGSRTLGPGRDAISFVGPRAVGNRNRPTTESNYRGPRAEITQNPKSWTPASVFFGWAAGYLPVKNGIFAKGHSRGGVESRRRISGVSPARDCSSRQARRAARWFTRKPDLPGGSAAVNGKNSMRITEQIATTEGRESGQSIARIEDQEQRVVVHIAFAYP